jgi:sulfate-transporting ATPase
VIWVQYTLFGLGVGAMFALLAAGIVLVYRASGVLNFAHASMAMICAYVNFDLIERAHAPVAVALVAAMACGAVLGVVAQRLVFAPVSTASPVVKLIVSFGLAGVLQSVASLVWRRANHPNPFGHSLFALNHGLHVADVVVPQQRLALIGAGIVVSGGLAVLLRFTSFGIQLRALAQNRLAAQLAGIDTRRIERSTWAIAGASAALAGVLLIPFGALNPLSLSGFELKALAAALVGGFVSLPAALAGGLGLGVVQELLVGAPAPLNGMRTALSAVLVLALLLFGIERYFVSEQEQRALEGDDRLATGGRGVPIIGRPVAWVLGTVVVALIVGTLSGFWSFVATRTLVYALLALSLVTLTGWSGQVSLMPGTFAGVGACLAWVFGTRLGYPLPLVLPLAALATVPICAVVGVAALRLRPLYLAVGTVALAGLFEETLFRQHWFANGGNAMRVVRPVALRGDHAFAITVVIVTGALFAMTAAFGRSRTGRAFRMVAGNPGAAAAAGVNPVKYRLLAFVLSSSFAGLAGAVLAYLLGAYSSAAFAFLVLSLAVFGLATVGGIRSPLGALLGAFGFVYVSETLREVHHIDEWIQLSVSLGIIVVMARSPDGVVGLFGALRRFRFAGAVDG